LDAASRLPFEGFAPIYALEHGGSPQDCPYLCVSYVIEVLRPLFMRGRAQRWAFSGVTAPLVMRIFEVATAAAPTYALRVTHK
jgi:hypothetical protein